MDLANLLQASLDLEKRIATDQALRRCFNDLLNTKTSSAKAEARAKLPEQVACVSEVKASFPLETCLLLESVAASAGKTTSQVLEEAFLHYYRTRIEPNKARL
jgi:hypothetical protein